jgi:hypothetical protein
VSGSVGLARDPSKLSAFPTTDVCEYPFSYRDRFWPKRDTRETNVIRTRTDMFAKDTFGTEWLVTKFVLNLLQVSRTQQP